MESVLPDQEVQPAITRHEEARLYNYLRVQTDGDSHRYYVIAKKIQRAADGYANEGDVAIVRDWLDAMNEEAAARLAQARPCNDTAAVESQAFADVRRGVVGNQRYQAFLDTLEQDALDGIGSNVPYFEWISQRMRDAAIAGVTFDEAYLRQWADSRLSSRVKALRGLI